ncbi:GNAT family N-acetyltransferase [Falsibacillus albus]|uniref:GNAT family N-acetyltransferase n=1 Tax=Falsibacillus albus TaxID=2478915 RepID=UPI001314151A|nr:GNAT family N-acetyltransferase [Falsibacillus albus]
MEYQINHTHMEEEKEILFLLKETASWLKDKEIDQWGFLLNGGEDQEIKESIEQNQTYSVKRDGRLIASFTLYESQGEWDRYIWGQSKIPAVYLHRLAVDRTLVGQGIGKEIIKWIEDYLKNKGWTQLRLDCVAGNRKLNDFYLQAGFGKIGKNREHTKFLKSL